ncbi:MAG: hypothetical protein ABL914_10400 [Novosphingobium sp.]|uniref:hypothetical protein n=1 Tax=Novosphingobium sp. TaxID=1874826 RepID=UPI0032BA1672
MSIIAISWLPIAAIRPVWVSNSAAPTQLPVKLAGDEATTPSSNGKFVNHRCSTMTYVWSLWLKT